VVKLGWRDGLTREQAVDLAIHGLHEAADEDSATGGADLLRGIYPVVATITGQGFERLDDEELHGRYRELLDRLAAERGGAPS
jgi:proteasome beta subunit